MGPARYAINFSRALIAAFVIVGLTANVAAFAGAHKTAQSAPAAEAPGTIVEVAVGAGSFTTLVAALQAAGLVDALSGDGPFTVFAPTDAAFAALPEGTVESLLLPENKAQLEAVLLYHVIPGKVLSTDLPIDEAVNAETLQGKIAAVVRSSGWTEKQRVVTINSSKVTSANVAASNGVIHVIDAVLLPPEG